MPSKTNAQKIEYIAVEKLSVPTRRAREHPEKQLQALAKSIKRFGFTMPILVDERSRVLAGYGRLLAAPKAGFSEVPCLRVHHLSEEEKRAYMLADNRLAELSHWNNEVLAAELQDLGDLGFPVELTGFELPQVELILSEAAEASPDTKDEEENAIPPMQERAVTRLGDTWQLGRHVLFCGDARDPGAYVQVLGTAQADAVITDAPYNLAIRKDLSHQGANQHREFAMASGEMNSGEFLRFLTESFRAFKAVCRDGAIAFTFMDWRHLCECITAGEEIGLELKNLIVWNKSNAGMGTFYRSKHELIPVWKIGTAPHVNTFGLGDQGRYRTNVWDYAGVNTFKAERADELAYHPTVKPVALVMDAIKDVTHRGDIVLDIFGGSGTTLIAAQKVARSARLIELDPLYCDVTIRRFEKLSGQPARHALTRQTFGEVAAEREHTSSSSSSS